MKWASLRILAAVAMSAGVAVMALALAQAADTENVSPVYGVTIPEAYRQWEFIAPAQEAAPLNELRVVVGNKVALSMRNTNVSRDIL